MKIITLHGTGYFDKLQYLKDNKIYPYPIDWNNIFKRKLNLKNQNGLLVIWDKSFKGKINTNLLLKLNRLEYFEAIYLICEDKLNLNWSRQSYIEFPRTYDESEIDFNKKNNQYK